MNDTCSNIPIKIRKCIKDAVDDLTSNMTKPDMDQHVICVKSNISYDAFYEKIKHDIEIVVNEIINNHTTCDVNNTFEKLVSELNGNENLAPIISDDIENLTLEYITGPVKDTFIFDANVTTTLSNLTNVLVRNCQCHAYEIFLFIINKYREKYRLKFLGKTNEESIKIIHEDYNYIKSSLTPSFFDDGKDKVTNDISFTMMLLHGFSIESELGKLIPDDLGSMKDFFIKIISAYYNNLHPIVWSQIIAQMIDNIFIELPFGKEAMFQFVSKYVLLNSGPFILKILQMIRPILSSEIRTKYNLTKLKYPLLSKDNAEMILAKSVKDWDMYDHLHMQTFSASVGHVAITYRVDNPEEKVVIKIIKPISIAQSCWEYKTLMNVKLQPCEKNFVKGLLESNGSEMNVINEAKNIRDGHKYYTDNYQNVFGQSVEANITTIEVKEDIIDPECWFAIAMTLAPGIPLSELVEEAVLKTETKYRAKLHRCLDLFIYKFFQNLIQNGYYHGDPHAGNIFFSFKKSQLTLIDFGAVGELDIYKDDVATRGLLEIIVMSIFYNFDGILDSMTELLNSKCTETKVDINSEAYKKFKKQLHQHRITNIANHDKITKLSDKYNEDLNSEKRLHDEFYEFQAVVEPDTTDDSIYSYLERRVPSKETVIENKEILPPYTTITKEGDSISFPAILEMILKFYATSNINVPIKLSEFYEFQKSYALLLGVLTSVNYNPYRIGIAIKKAIVNLENLSKITEIFTIIHVVRIYYNENNKFNALQPIQKGSSTNYHKYLKYKHKYLDLKRKL